MGRKFEKSQGVGPVFLSIRVQNRKPQYVSPVFLSKWGPKMEKSQGVSPAVLSKLGLKF